VNRQTLQTNPNPIALTAQRINRDGITRPEPRTPRQEPGQTRKIHYHTEVGVPMPEQQKSNIAASFFHIHNIITRGLKVSIENLQRAQKYGFQNESSREGLVKFIRALTSVLNSHHLTEDEIAFPYFRDKLPGAPFDALMKQHQKMVILLTEIDLALDKWERAEQLDGNLIRLENALTRLYDAWLPHIHLETVEFIVKADALIPVEEQLRLITLFSKHSQKYAVPPELTVPFLLYNLPPEDRSAFSKDIPAEVVQHLVPVVWRTHWEPMTPYLLTSSPRPWQFG
jgi:hemerythrin-like domain-containing protein